jgi:hypothetical protein
LHPDLKRWIDTGEITGLAVEPLLRTDDDTTSDERADLLLGLLEASLEAYQGDYDDVKEQRVRDPASLSGPPLWTGIATMLFREIDELRRAARSYGNRLGEGSMLL